MRTERCSRALQSANQKPPLITKNTRTLQFTGQIHAQGVEFLRIEGEYMTRNWDPLLQIPPDKRVIISKGEVCMFVCVCACIYALGAHYCRYPVSMYACMYVHLKSTCGPMLRQAIVIISKGEVCMRMRVFVCVCVCACIYALGAHCCRYPVSMHACMYVALCSDKQ